MTTEAKKEPENADRDREKSAIESATGTEAKRKGGIEPAKRQAKRDWEESAKESGD